MFELQPLRGLPHTRPMGTGNHPCRPDLFGGHLEGGTLALTFANIAIGEIEDSVSIVGWDTIIEEEELQSK